MNKKICVLVIALIMLCMVMGVVFAQNRNDYCPTHARQNAKGEFVSGCQTCRTAKIKYDKRQADRADNERKLREQKQLLAKKEREKAAAETPEEAKQIDQEIRTIRVTIISIEAELD